MLLITIALVSATATDTPGTPEKKVCRSVQTTGSMFAKNVCRTRAEWAQIDGADQAHAAQLQDGVRRGGNRPSQSLP